MSMNGFGRQSRSLRDERVAGLESPFLDEELFVEETEVGWASALEARGVECPFLQLDLRVGEQEIIDADERTVIGDTLRIPNRWICAIDIVTENPKWGQQGQGKLIVKSRGTGILIGPRYVLTARHLWSEDVKAMMVSPARNGSNSSNPFGKVKAKAYQRAAPYRMTLRVTSGPKAGTETTVTRQDDYMLIVLEQDLASQTHARMQGTLGYWGQDPSQAVVRDLPPDSINGRQIVVIGYPGDTCGERKFSGSKADKQTPMENCWSYRNDEWASRQWRSVGSLQTTGNSSRLFHTADTYEGQSGAPICLTLGQTLHLAGIHEGEDTPQQNKGVRATTRMLREVCAWMNADAGYTIASLKDGMLIVQPAGARKAPASEFLSEFGADDAEGEDFALGRFDGEIGREEFGDDAAFAPAYEDVEYAQAENAQTSEDGPGFEHQTASGGGVATWAAGIEPFPATPTLAFHVNDSAMTSAFAPIRSSPVRHLCTAVVDLTGSPLALPYAGLNDTDMVFAGSMLKICAMYAAFALRAQVQAFVDAAKANGASVILPDISVEIEKAWRPKLQALFPAHSTVSFANKRDITFPRLEEIFTFSPAGRVDFTAATPSLSDKELDKAGEFGVPPGKFQDWMRLMMRWSSNTASSNCILALGYFYINGALDRAGFFDSTTRNGLWLSADYKGHDWVATPEQKRIDAAGQPLMPRWATAQKRTRSNITATAEQTARMMALLAVGQLVAPDANHPDPRREMRELLQSAIKCVPGGQCGIGSYVQDALNKPPRLPFTSLAAKKGFGNDSLSHECAIVERTVGGQHLRYVVVGLGSAPARGRRDLSDLFRRLDRVIVTRNQPPAATPETLEEITIEGEAAGAFEDDVAPDTLTADAIVLDGDGQRFFSTFPKFGALTINKVTVLAPPSFEHLIDVMLASDQKRFVVDAHGDPNGLAMPLTDGTRFSATKHALFTLRGIETTRTLMRLAEESNTIWERASGEDVDRWRRIVQTMHSATWQKMIKGWPTETPRVSDVAGAREIVQARIAALVDALFPGNVLNKQQRVDRLIQKMLRLQAKGIREIQFRACNIGKDGVTLREFRRFFGADHLCAPDVRSGMGPTTLGIGRGAVDRLRRHRQTQLFEMPSGRFVIRIDVKGHGFRAFCAGDTSGAAVEWVGAHIMANPKYRTGPFPIHFLQTERHSFPLDKEYAQHIQCRSSFWEGVVRANEMEEAHDEPPAPEASEDSYDPGFHAERFNEEGFDEEFGDDAMFEAAYENGAFGETEDAQAFEG